MESTLWYKKPAHFYRWTEALPVGNGRLGAMVFGGTARERIQLNEDSCWSGGFRERNNQNAKENLAKIRELLSCGKITEAEELARFSLTGTPEFQRTYQTLGDLYINYKNQPADITEYRRSLDLDDAVCRTGFMAGGFSYTREVFAAFNSDVIVVRHSTNNPSGISFDMRLVRNRYCESTGSIDSDKIYLDGVNGGANGIEFSCMAFACPTGGNVKTIGEYVICENAREVVVYIAASTSFREQSPLEKCMETLQNAAKKGYEKIYGEHVDCYGSLEKRVSLNLTEDKSALPTDERLALVKEGKTDLGLFELYFRFGRYLLISSSYGDCLPANLQGIWCQDFLPAWDSKYTININAQMNYWPAEICNLSECHMPLISHLHRVHKNGTKTARDMYGCGGFVAHHNTDIWGDAAPQDTWVGATYWVLGAAWLCLHIWEHYEYTRDVDFLREHYYLMKDAAQFFVEFLIENREGELVVSPTISPENIYVLPGGGHGWLTEGCAMDSQILAELFLAVEESCRILNIEPDFAANVAKLRNKLPKTKIGANGGIMEWLENKEEAEPGHRHMSHLFALYPGNHIRSGSSPKFAEAARKTLEMRLEKGGGHTGWSRAWIINFYARLCDGNKAWEHLNELLKKSTLPNLFDDHPPFQIDGNFGATAAIAQMLVDSDSECVYLLQALPEAWQNGCVCGLMAKGGIEVDVKWTDGRLEHAKFTAKNDFAGKVAYRGMEKVIQLKKGESCEIMSSNLQ